MDLVCPFVDYWWLYAAFTAFIAALLALDLGVFHRTALDVTFRESLTWSVIWVALALLFNYGFYRYAVTQHRVLFYGILGALVFRAVFIALGSVLMQYHWVVVLSGGLLLATGGSCRVALLFLEMSDVIFAIDSVPAIFALTRANRSSSSHRGRWASSAPCCWALSVRRS